MSPVPVKLTVSGSADGATETLGDGGPDHEVERHPSDQVVEEDERLPLLLEPGHAQRVEIGDLSVPGDDGRRPEGSALELGEVEVDAFLGEEALLHPDEDRSHVEDAEAGLRQPVSGLGAGLGPERQDQHDGEEGEAAWGSGQQGPLSRRGVTARRRCRRQWTG